MEVWGTATFHGEEAREPTVLPEKMGPRIIGIGKGNVSFDLPRENHETPEAGGQDEGATPLRKPLTADRIGMAGPSRGASFVIPPCPTPSPCPCADEVMIIQSKDRKGRRRL